MSTQLYQKQIDACIECASVCNHCAISCLAEKDVQHLTKCIRLCLECAVVTRTAAELMTLESRHAKEVYQLCATVCDACADECEHYAAGMEHCRECMDACRTCANGTLELYQQLINETPCIGEQLIHQSECAVISGAAAELMSLQSDYSKQICDVSAAICNAYSEQLNDVVKKELEYAGTCASIATKANDLYNAGNRGKSKETSNQNEDIKKKKKHSSALLAASLWRSPFHHELAHVSGGLRGEYANLGTNLSYDEED